MTDRANRILSATLAAALIVALAGGCGLFQKKDEAFDQPSSTRSNMPDRTTSGSESTTTPPPETWMEPAREWGSETRDNVERP